MPSYTFYIDETGNRHPDQKPDPKRTDRDWFAIGGILVRNEDIVGCRERHQAFIDKWKIKSPLHMTDMLGNHKKFSWLGRLREEEHDKFWRDLKTMLASIRAVGLACVIDRPGYVARGYLEEHRDRWLLCRSAFDIAVERAAKFARAENRKLRVVFEQDPGINQMIKGYFQNLKDNGHAFNIARSDKYGPLTQAEFKETLATIEHKPKAHPMLQIADSYLYSMARQPYDQKFHVVRRLRDSQKLANSVLAPDDVQHMGIKYYCFEHRNAKKNKAGD
ncbi:DUF3800 domain-containing protein [Salipiger thiooxidans]|uniref:DUF3800 domain-containing protein n=1 Tax=Salipiger thiooxidans TaxID=282683 RepID=UPI001A8F4CDD|nr:DUF3800 domain-containing protein [Salipiger thiooxidans]MBN8190233.1 DUF3800 domain-containing protein [Salipiger thiooxidans]